MNSPRFETLGVASAAVCLGAAFLTATPASAHPHAWIDLKTAPQFSEDGRVSGLEVNWIFDELYTVFVAEVLDTDKDGHFSADELHELTRNNLDNLSDYGYFTFWTVDGEPGRSGNVTEFSSSLEDGRLSMRFVVPFQDPPDPVATTVTYAVYDPTYYIEILHEQEADSIDLTHARLHNCGIRLQGPKPDQDTIQFASLLDVDESGGDGLGKHFAEYVTLECQTSSEPLVIRSPSYCSASQLDTSCRAGRTPGLQPIQDVN